MTGALAAAAGCRRRRGAGFPGYAFVANQEGQAVAAVDLTAFAVARHIRLGEHPTELVAPPSLDSVYALAPAAGVVCEISAGQLALGRKFHFASEAVSMRLAPEGDRLWLLCREPRQLIEISIPPLRVQSRIALRSEPADFDVSRDGQMAAVSFGTEGEVALVGLDERRLRWVADLGAPLGTVRFQSDGKRLLVARVDAHMLSALHTPTGKVVTHLPLAIRPRHFCFKSDGGQLFITGEGLDAVVVVYPYQTQVAETLLAGHAPESMAASSSPDYLFVANPTSGNVTILDIETHRVIAAASVGSEPGFIAITPDNQYALVLNRGSGDMAVIRIPAITARRAKSAPLFTMIPVGSRPVCAVVRAV